MQKNKILGAVIAILFAIGMSACAGEKVPGESNIPSQSHSSSIDSEIAPDDSVETDSSFDDSVETDSTPDDSGGEDSTPDDSGDEDSSVGDESSEETWTGIYKP